jgi:hypothetical protein
MGWTAGVRIQAGVMLSLFIASRPALGTTHPTIQWLAEDLSLRIKRQGREADHLPLPSAEVKNVAKYVFMAWRLMK